MEVKKFLDQEGLSYLWKKLSLQDYPNNDTLVAIINAIDENKLDKSTAIAILENAVAGQVPIVKSVDENGKPLEWEAGDLPEGLPSTDAINQYLTIDADGNKVWEEKLAYYTKEEQLLVPECTVEASSTFMIRSSYEAETGDECRVILDGKTYTGSYVNPNNGMFGYVQMTEGEGFPATRIFLVYAPYSLSGSAVGFSGQLTIYAKSKVIRPIKQEFLGVSIGPGEGINAVKIGNLARSEASGGDSVAIVEGKATGPKSVAINSGIASGINSFAQGTSEASGVNSVSFGLGTQATGYDQMVSGSYNIADENNKYVNIVGNGVSGYDENDNYHITESNAYTLDWDGNAWFQGTIKLGGTGQDDETAVEIATKSDVSTLQEAINILNGTGEGSVQDTVTDAIANVVANAPEELDTLKEIADWIANDETGTVNLIERVEKAEEEIEALKPLDVQPDWDQTDETAMDFIKNKPDEEDALAVLMEVGFIEPVASSDGSVFTDSNGALYSL